MAYRASLRKRKVKRSFPEKPTLNLILFNKPFRVLCQFRQDKDRPERKTLANYIHHQSFYAAGRLDFDSEGLLLLTSDGKLQQAISDPKFKLEKTYWVQVEGDPTDMQLKQLCTGIELKDGWTKPALASRIAMPEIWPREPAVTPHRDLRSHWIKLSLREGKNRQVRRMCAAVGLPVLRLIRSQIGDWQLDKLLPGELLETQTTIQKHIQVSKH